MRLMLKLPQTSLYFNNSQNYAVGIREHYHESSGCFEYIPT